MTLELVPPVGKVIQNRYANFYFFLPSRINALAMIFYSKPSATDLAKVLAVLKTDTDYEVVNMAYSMFEQFATTINPCHAELKDKAKFFLKYLKQYSRYETEYGFGVSKTFSR